MVKPCANVLLAISAMHMVTVANLNVPLAPIVAETKRASITNASILVRAFAAMELVAIRSIIVPYVHVPMVWLVIHLPLVSHKIQLSTFAIRHRAVRMVFAVSLTIEPFAHIQNVLSTMTAPQTVLVSISDAVIRVITLAALTPSVGQSTINQFVHARLAMPAHHSFNVQFNVMNQSFQDQNVRETMIVPMIGLALMNNAEILVPNRMHAVRTLNVMHNCIVLFVCAVKDTQAKDSMDAIELDVVPMPNVRLFRLVSMKNVLIRALELSAVKMHSVVSKVIIEDNVIVWTDTEAIRWYDVSVRNVRATRIVRTIWNVKMNVVRIRAIVVWTHSVAFTIIVAFVSVHPDSQEMLIKFVQEVSSPLPTCCHNILCYYKFFRLVPILASPQCTMDSDCPSKHACFSGVCKNACEETKPCGEHASCSVIDSLPLRTIVCQCDPGYIGDAKVACRLGNLFLLIYRYAFIIIYLLY